MRQPGTWIAAVVALLCGGLLGLLFTIAHRAEVGGVPVGLILGIVATAAFLAGCRLLAGSRLPAIGAGIGVVAAQLLLSLPGAGGSVLVADGTLGLVWTIAPAFLAALAIAWPDLARIRADRMESTAQHHGGAQ